ncbi:hypothetical protein HOY82DRAFT_596062 [Tuber indicum]|nr:hypothetical protein HOY82DRAFT_596062 [Tuber indicum]
MDIGENIFSAWNPQAEHVPPLNLDDSEDEIELEGDEINCEIHGSEDHEQCAGEEGEEELAEDESNHFRACQRSPGQSRFVCIDGDLSRKARKQLVSFMTTKSARK